MSLNESHVEDAALTWFWELGYAVAYGPNLGPQIALSMPGFRGQDHPMHFNSNHPACGSGGMFVQSEKFIESHGGQAKREIRSASVEVQPVRKSKFAARHFPSFVIRNSSFDISSRPTTRRLAIMNLALRGIEADFGPENADTFRRDLHPDLRADYVLANPPFNDSDMALCGSAFLQSEAKPQVVSEAKENFRKDDDVRWQFGVPPKGNANFAWVQHFIHHLAPGETSMAAKR